MSNIDIYELSKTELIKANELLINKNNKLEFEKIELENELNIYKGSLKDTIKTNQDLRDENISLKNTIDELYKKITNKNKGGKDDFVVDMLSDYIKTMNTKIKELQKIINDLENKIKRV